MDWKTTLPGLVAAVALIGRYLFGINIPDEVQNAIVTICVFFIGLFATSKGAQK